MTRRPPGQWGMPWLGHSLAFLRHPLRFMQRQEGRFGLIFKSRLIGRKMVFLLGPEANQALLSTHADRVSTPEGYGPVATGLFGDALIAQEGEIHGHYRRQLASAFRPEGMAQILRRISPLIDHHLAEWQQAPEIELYRSFKHLAFSMATQALIGHDPGPDAPRLVAAFDRFSAGLFTPFPVAIPGTTYARAWRGRALIEAYLQGRIDARRNAPAPSSDELPDVLGSLLNATTPSGQPLTQAQIVSQLLLMLFAGHDTTASLATWLTLELSHAHDWREQLRQELDEHDTFDARDAEGVPTVAFLRQLPLLEATIREGERMYPPAPTGFRGVLRPFEVAGWTIPAGWTAIYSPLFTHHMASLFPSPSTFDPARMMAPRQEHKQHAYALIGFGGGPRKCIGEHLANIELKAVFATLLKRYDWTLRPGQDVSPAFVPSMHPAKGLYATVTPRRPTD